MILSFLTHRWSTRRCLQILHFKEAFWDSHDVLHDYSHAFTENLRKISADIEATKFIPYPKAPVATSQVHTAHLFAKNCLPQAHRQTTESYFLVLEEKTLYHYIPAWLYLGIRPQHENSNWDQLSFSAPLSWGENAFTELPSEWLLFFHNQTPRYSPPLETTPFRTVRVGDFLDPSLQARSHAPGPLFNWSSK